VFNLSAVCQIASDILKYTINETLEFDSLNLV